jgi:hypothetical protein
MFPSFDSGNPGPLDPSLLDAILDAAGLSGRRRRIRCPLCDWEPRRFDRWECFCGTAWNTFDTGGRCPGCGHLYTVDAVPALLPAVGPRALVRVSAGRGARPEPVSHSS